LRTATAAPRLAFHFFLRHNLTLTSPQPLANQRLRAFNATSLKHQNSAALLTRLHDKSMLRNTPACTVRGTRDADDLR